MPTTYKGLTIPLSSDLADGPAAFRDYTDSLPYQPFATTGDRDTWTTAPNGALCFTIDTGTLWLRKLNVWQPVYPIEDFIFGDLGSQTVGGMRDIAPYAGVVNPYPVKVTVNATVEFGFGAAGPCTINADIFRYSDNTTAQSQAQVSPAAQWAHISLGWCWLVAAGQSSGFKIRGNGIAFSGGNCYFRGFATYRVQAV